MRKASCRRTSTLATSLLLVTSFLTSACGQVDSSADEHIARAEQAYAKDNLRTALIEIKNALQLEPDRAEARRVLGEYYLQLGQGAEAEAELTRAQTLGTDPAALRLPLLRAWLLQGKHPQVIEATETFETDEPSQQSIMLTLRAQALLIDERLEEARATLEQALSLDPANAEALLGFAWVEWLGDDLAATRTKLQAALDINPALDRAWELLGDVEREAGRLEEAEEAYRQAIETTHHPLSPRVKRALTNLSQQDAEAVDQDVQVLAREFASHPEVSFVRGLAALSKERYLDARMRLEETLYRDPNHVPALYYLGKAHYGLGNLQQAESYLSYYISLVRNAPEASRLLASIRMQGGRTYSAEIALNAQLYRSPADEPTLAMISNLYLAQGRADEALYHLRHATAMQPDSAKTRAQLGIALMETDQREEGLNEFERAIELAPEGSARLEIAMIMERLRAGEYEQALALIERLSQRDEVHPALYYNLKGLAYIAQGDSENAEAVFREGLETVPDAKADLASNLAGVLARNRRLDEARELANAYLEDNPEHLGLLSNLARLSLASGDTEQAEALLKRAIAAHPQALPQRRGLAELYLRSERPEEAVAVLRDGEAMYGRSAEWLRSMAQALLDSADREAAVDILRRLQEQQPDAADVSLMLGRLLVDLGQVDEGRKALEQGLSQQPDHLGARLLIVELLTQEGQFERATKRLAPALQSHPNHPEVLGRAGAIAYSQGRLQEAIDAFQQALEQAPEERRLIGALAQAQYDAGHTATSVTILSDWLEKKPNDQEMRLLLANRLLTLEREDEAIAAYRRLLEGTPDIPIALNNLAWLLRAQDPDEALRLIDRALELAPRVAALLDTKGTVQMEQGDYAGATATLEAAIEITPQAPSIRLNLAKALLAAGRDLPAQEQLEILVNEHPGTPEHDEAARLLEL